MLLTHFLMALVGMLKAKCVITANRESVPFGSIFSYGQIQMKNVTLWEIRRFNDKGSSSFNAFAHLATLNDPHDNFAAYRAVCSLMQKGIFALVGNHDVNTIDTIKSLTSTFQMPFVTAGMTMDTSGQDRDFHVHMQPVYTQALTTFMKMRGWKHVYYVYSDTSGLHRLDQLFRSIHAMEMMLTISAKRVTSGVDVIRTLGNIQYRDKNAAFLYNIILDLPVATMKDFLDLVKAPSQTKLSGDRFHYLLAGLVIDELHLEKYYKRGGINIAGFRIVDHGDKTVMPSNDTGRLMVQQALIIDGVEVLLKALQNLKVDKPNIFNNVLNSAKNISHSKSDEMSCAFDSVKNNLLNLKTPVPWKYGWQVLEAIKKTRLKGLTGNVQFDNFGHRTDFRMDLLDVTRGRGLAKVGSWHPTEGLTVEPASIIYPRKVGRKVKIVTSLLERPYLMLKKPTPSEEILRKYPNERFEGYCADLARKLAEMIGFEYEFRIVKDGKYGEADADGKWNGMVGEVFRHEADIAIAPLTVTTKRESVVAFSKPFMAIGISIMLKKPSRFVPGYLSFMHPLCPEIWTCGFYALVAVSVVLFLVSRFSHMDWYVTETKSGSYVGNKFTVCNSLWFSAGSLMQQGSDLSPRSVSGRIVACAWWFFTLIIVSSYTANLAAYLTSERMQTPIKTVDDLAKQTYIKYGTVRAGSTKEFFQTSPITRFQQMWESMQVATPSVFVSSIGEGVRRVRESNGRYAFLVESSSNDYANQQKPCDTLKIGQNLDSKSYGIATSHDFELREEIDLTVLQLRESGELQRLRHKWWYIQGECPPEDEQTDTTASLQLSSVVGILITLVTGLGLALLVALFEFVYKTRVEARTRKMPVATAARSLAAMSITGEQDSHEENLVPFNRRR